MQALGRRLLALLLAALLTAALWIPASAESGDWRDMLRDYFGLSEDYEGDEQTEVQDEQTEVYEREWELPITEPQDIVDYLYLYGELPENFITKDEAKSLGWDSSYNYVGDVAPGMSIGGDRFGNYEGLLPKAKGRQYYECDVHYKGKKRGAERLIYSNDGLYFYTNDHYESFTEMYPEVDEP